MKKAIIIAALAALFTSCGSAPKIASHDLPPTEQAWAEAIQASYPDWQAPSYAPIDQ